MVEALVGAFIVMVLFGAFCIQIKMQTIVWRSVRDVLRQEDFEGFRRMRWWQLLLVACIFVLEVGGLIALFTRYRR